MIISRYRVEGALEVVDGLDFDSGDYLCDVSDALVTLCHGIRRVQKSSSGSTFIEPSPENLLCFTKLALAGPSESKPFETKYGPWI